MPYRSLLLSVLIPHTDAVYESIGDHVPSVRQPQGKFVDYTTSSRPSVVERMAVRRATERRTRYGEV